MNLKALYDSESAESKLFQDEPISDLASETYLEIALTNWLPTVQLGASEANVRLAKLAAVLNRNHQDPWLSEFTEAGRFPRANKILQSAIKANLAGDPDKAARDARAAHELFIRRHNNAGASRSEFEIVYALRRGSHPEQCIDEISRFQALLTGRNFHWLETQLLLEFSGCEAMLTHFDNAWRLANSAIQNAQKYHYPILALRAQGFQASLHSVEGRFQQSWQGNFEGLETFWRSFFPADRAFQFYSDLELVAERSEQWHLAIVVQREALQMLGEGKRQDVTAMAHFRLIGLLESVNDIRESSKELEVASMLFSRMSPGQSKDLYLAYSEINLASLLARRGATTPASEHLRNVVAYIDQWNNFNLHLRYLRVASEIARDEQDRREESLLNRLVILGDSGFNRLRSGKNRWEWDHEIGTGYRRLLELDILHSDDATQHLADWEYYRSKAGSGMTLAPGPPIGNSSVTALLRKRISLLHRSTLVTFAVLTTSVVAWVADDRGVREFHLPVDPTALSKEVRRFYELCSTPHSSIEKVSASGSRLYEWLITPMQTELEDRRILYIEADGFVDRIPWSVLTMKGGTYFGEHYTIVNTPGLFYRSRSTQEAGSLRFLAADPGAVDSQEAQYLPLPHAEEEAYRVASLYSDKLFLTGKSVTASALVKELPHAFAFHFSGHATNRGYGGELLVHDDNGNGTTLSASSVSNLTLRHTRLVVLSACSTAMSERELASNPNGLVSAFLQAGATHVVASNWDVDSASAASMMIEFHKLIRSGYSVSQALAESRHAVFSSAETHHPYYWAAFAEFSYLPLQPTEAR